jgi:choline dehydrogenase-like flavoprotein
MGVGSSVMGMIALRGLPTNYAAWESIGARNWGWHDVLPTFQAMIDGRASPGRNVCGPNIVRRLPRAIWPAYMVRLKEVLAGQGVPSHANIYDTDADGFCDPAQPGSRARRQRALLFSRPRRGRGPISRSCAIPACCASCSTAAA